MLEAARVQDLLTNTSKQSTVAFYQIFMYKHDKAKESIFTPNNLQAMCEFEKSLVNFKVGLSVQEESSPAATISHAAGCWVSRPAALELVPMLRCQGDDEDETCMMN
jgi:hypothetical protein